MTKAHFRLDLDVAKNLPVPRVPLSYAWKFIRDGETPGRVLNDCASRAFLPFLEGSETVYELGGTDSYYRDFMPVKRKYVVANVDAGADLVIVATAIDLPSGSVDAFCSMFA